MELNTWHSTKLIGMHDIYEIEAPWYRSPIRITQPVEIIGMPYIEVSPEHIKGIILTHQPDEARSMTPSTETTDCIGQHMADFLVDNMQRGYINSKKLILQSGVGSGANAVLGALGQCTEVPDFNIYTEVLQEEPLRLIQEGRVVSASTGALTISSEHLKNLYKNINDYRGRLLIRPSEISNCPEIIARLGICSLNTAIEVDIYGHVNSTKILGTKMMNGVGGSADFTCNAMLATFTCGSTAKDGKSVASCRFAPMLTTRSTMSTRLSRNMAWPTCGAVAQWKRPRRSLPLHIPTIGPCSTIISSWQSVMADTPTTSSTPLSPCTTLIAARGICA